jgi:hypothetical protein
VKQGSYSSDVGKGYLLTSRTSGSPYNRIVQNPKFCHQTPFLVFPAARLYIMAGPNPDHPTRLTGKKGDHTFAMWVEVEGRPLEIYGITEGEDRILEAWVASEIDKVSLYCPIGVSDSYLMLTPA